MTEGVQPEDARSDTRRDPKQPGGAIGGLFKSLTDLAATLLSMAQTRLELLTTELQEEVQRAAGVIVWAFIALLSATIALFMGGLTIVFFYWETHRVLAALLVTAAFLTFAIVAVALLVSKMNGRPRFLDATLTELSKDNDSLRSRL